MVSRRLTGTCTIALRGLVKRGDRSRASLFAGVSVPVDD